MLILFEDNLFCCICIDFRPTYSRKSHDIQSNVGSGDSAQKKFGGAKAISSDQFFGGPEKDVSPLLFQIYLVEIEMKLK